MDRTENKFHIIDKEDSWRVKKEDDRFFALKAKLNKMIKKNKKLLTV
jgi:hypothetical protein